MAARSRAAEIRYPPLTLTTEFSIIRRRTLNTAVAGRIASCSQTVVLTRRNAGKDEEAMAGTRRVAGGLPVVITARVGTDRRAPTRHQTCGFIFSGKLALLNGSDNSVV